MIERNKSVVNSKSSSYLLLFVGVIEEADIRDDGGSL